VHLSAPIVDPLDAPAAQPLLEEYAQARRLSELLDAWEEEITKRDAAGPEHLGRLSIVYVARRNLALLWREPELVFQCLYNGLYWEGAPEIAACYGWEFNADALAANALLRAWLSAWRERRKAQGAKGTWARSLLPPIFSLYCPLIEQYMHDGPDGGCVSFMDNGETLVHHAATPIAWNRKTGERLDNAPLPSSEKRFVLERSEDEGRHVVDQRTGERVCEVEASLHGVEADSAGNLYLCGSDEDGEGYVCRLDPPYEQASWHAHADNFIMSIAVDDAGRWVAVGTRLAVLLFDAKTGERLAYLPIAAGVAFDPEGNNLATWREHWIGVWDVETLAGGTAVFLDGVHDGFVEAQFSPDGRRLLTGMVLWDAREGRRIASLELEGDGYLVGGPPRDGRWLANTLFIEMSPIQGLRAWETSEGKLVASGEDDSHYSASDIVRISPDGMSYACARDASFGEAAKIELHKMTSSEPTAELAERRIGCMRFSSSGSLFAVGSKEGGVEVVRIPGAAPVRSFEAHSDAVTDLFFSIDEKYLLTAGLDQTLKVWRLADGALVGERVIDAEDPVTIYQQARSGEYLKSWQASTEALERVEGWLGWKAQTHQYSGRRSAGLFEIVDRESGSVVARIPVSGRLESDCTGTRWASGGVLYAIEFEG